MYLAYFKIVSFLACISNFSFLVAARTDNIQIYRALPLAIPKVYNKEIFVFLQKTGKALLERYICSYDISFSCVILFVFTKNLLFQKNITSWIIICVLSTLKSPGKFASVLEILKRKLQLEKKRGFYTNSSPAGEIAKK